VATVGWRVAVPLVLALGGLLMATSAQTARGTDLRSARLSDLADLVRAQAARVDAAQAGVQQLRTQVDALTATAVGGPVAAARAQGDRLAPGAGLTPMTGPGLVVTLDDARRDPGSPLPAGVTADDLVVHQQDLQAVVNALWRGGAQGMQVQDQRLISTSAVRCVGNQLILQGRVYSPPYVIRAVGNQQQLLASVNEDTYLQNYLQYVAAYGLGWKLDQPKAMTLPAYSGTVDLQYAKAQPAQ
jgi:uncharacterized protein YlxW (UPF0749 family)